MLDESQKKRLRGIGHGLKPVIMVGEAGLSEALYSEFDATLAHHQLIKVRVRVGNRQARDDIVAALCERSGAMLVQRIGNIALLYRENPDRKKLL